jgi:hypothetical protein
VNIRAALADPAKREQLKAALTRSIQAIPPDRLRPWTDKIDPATIPDAVIASENARRNARKRQSYTGGAVWAKHNGKVTNCRCKRCNARRAKEQCQ